MAPPFRKLTRDQFTQLVEVFDFERRIDSVHMHHTWRPSRAQFRGHDTLVAMWRFHTETNGWSDIAQHITIDPQGHVWLGRNWNQPPASAKGFNGNVRVGPFMFEIVGNFDHGGDPFNLDGEQERTVIKVIAAIQKKFHLAPETLRFHNTMSTKTCPGSAIRYGDILEAVRERRRQLDEASRQPPPFGPEARQLDADVQAALQMLAGAAPRGGEPADAEPEHNELAGTAQREGTRGFQLAPETLDALRPHLVNLAMGEFSTQGQLKTSREDVDALFEEHLPRALAEVERRNQAEGRHDRLRLLFYAHGGLIKESAGLEIAHQHLGWWQSNGIYPIYFIWETGLFETIGQLLRRTREQGRRALARDIWDYTTDPLIELTVRALQGPRILGGIKRSAELAVSDEDIGPPGRRLPRGGARYVAEKLKEFCDHHPGKVELHAVGHSAGAVFHAHFLATARQLEVPSFKTVHFLAPAVRVDTFKKLLKDQLGEGRGIDHLTLFALRKTLELADHVEQIYHKSILYLVYYAGEPQPETPLLGLEICLRNDPELKTLFGLGLRPSAVGEVVWSTTPLTTGRSASRSVTHGGFDDDGPTLNSIARRVLDKADADEIQDYPEQGGRETLWEDQVDWPEALTAAAPVPPAVTPAPFSAPLPAPAVLPARGPVSGRRRALCIGIDRYPRAPLAGCVADANTWVQSLIQIGFEPPVLLTDERATRSAVTEQLTALVASATPGDVLVFQFAGHGTQLPDLDGDENDAKDEALLPYDYENGAFLIDDDVAGIFTGLPEGVNLTCFMDCCHSGTNTRFAVGAPPLGALPGRDERPRFLVATPEMIEKHTAFRRGLGGQRALTRAPHRAVSFSACQPHEVAWESEGHGEFTLRASRVLRAGIGGLTNQAFQERLIAEFGPTPRQKPLLDCPPSASGLALLAPLGAVGLPGLAAGDAKGRAVAALEAAIQALKQL